MKILCVEDDISIAKLLKITLTKQRYQVDLAHDGKAGWELGETYKYDLIILDVMLPNLDGISFCRKIRSDSSFNLNPNRETPIILITALDTLTNKIIGLDAGANDYLTKPFNLDDLLARIQGLIQRNQIKKIPLLIWGDLCIDPNICQVTYQEKPIYLAGKEYEILELFLRYPNQVFSSSWLLHHIRTADKLPSEAAVRRQIKGLRDKLKQAGVADILETIYKQGYRLKPEDSLKKYAQEDINSITSSNSDLYLDLKAAWIEYRQSYSDRLGIIQQAVTAGQNGTLTPTQQYEAEKEAHTLIGSLGCFGLEQASQIAREIQQILKQEKALTPAKIAQIEQLAIHLQQEMSEYGGENQTESLPSTPETYSASLLIG